MSIVDPSLTLAQTLERLGNVPTERIRMKPALGTARPTDVEAIRAKEQRLFELVDGILVEKTVGFRESLIALFIASRLREFATQYDLGLVVGADGMMRLFGNTVRIPDAAFIAWDRLPDRRVPDGPVPELVPTIAVEVLSSSNTAGEMDRKRREYCDAGVEQVWEVDLEQRTIAVYEGSNQTVLTAEETLRCGQLPGFGLHVAEVFAELDRHGK